MLSVTKPLIININNLGTKMINALTKILLKSVPVKVIAAATDAATSKAALNKVNKEIKL